jgi:hypothetical protein
MPNRVLFIDPHLSHVAGGAERLTLEKIQALDPNRFAVSNLNRGDRQPDSALFRAFRQARPDSVDIGPS